VESTGGGSNKAYSAGCKWALRAAATHAILPHTISFPGGRGAKELRAAAAAAAAAAAPVARAAACWLLRCWLCEELHWLSNAPPPPRAPPAPPSPPAAQARGPPGGGSVAFDRAAIGAGKYFCFWCLRPSAGSPHYAFTTIGRSC
jgi:hypothetical protein